MHIDLPEGVAVLVDSSVLVYLVEGKPSSPRRIAIERFFARAKRDKVLIVASAVVWAELLAKPLASGDAELAARYRRLLADSARIVLREVDVAVAEAAAELAASIPIARRRSLSSFDLLHMATALSIGAAAVLTNDEAWRSVPRCPPLILVDELAAEEGF